MRLGRAMNPNNQNGPLSERKRATHFRPNGKGPVPTPRYCPKWGGSVLAAARQCPKWIRRLALAAYVVMFVIVSLQHVTEAVAYADQPLKKAVSLSFAKNVIVARIAINPNISSPVLYFLGRSQCQLPLLQYDVKFLANGLGSNNIVLDNFNIPYGIGRRFGAFDIGANFDDDTRSFAVVFETDFCHRQITRGNRIFINSRSVLVGSSGVDAIKEIILDNHIEPRSLSGDGGIGGFFCGGGSDPSKVKLILNFDSLSVSGLLGQFKLSPSLSNLSGGNLTAGSDLKLAGFVEVDRRIPETDGGKRQNYREGRNNSFVVGFNEIPKTEYERRKRSLENVTVFFAIITAAGGVTWWVAGRKR